MRFSALVAFALTLSFLGLASSASAGERSFQKTVKAHVASYEVPVGNPGYVPKEWRELQDAKTVEACAEVVKECETKTKKSCALDPLKSGVTETSWGALLTTLTISCEATELL